MTEDQRENVLRGLARSDFMIALKEFILEQIEEIKDVSNIPNQGFEIEGRARQKAIKKMNDLLNKLYLLGEDKPRVPKNEYR